MGDNEVTGASARPWSYEIQYGSNGEEIYAWVYYHDLMVCTVKVHHAKMIVEAVNNHDRLTTENAELRRERDEARALVRLHHDWHLQSGIIGLQDGEGGWIEINNASEYSDSLMYERSQAFLENQPTEFKPMPRGGISAWWWQVAVLQRRQLRAAEARAASRSAPVDREAVARALCESGKFETGEGTCSLLCMDQLGSVRKKGCNHHTRIHGKLADRILSLLRPAHTKPTIPDAIATPVEAEGVGEPKPAGWQRSLKYAHVPEWEQCSTSEATSHFDRSPYHDYRPFYTHPPKSPDTSAALLQRALEQALNSLAEIAAAHIPDCPAHYAGDELSWAQRHVGCLRQKAEIARDGIAAAIRQLPTTELVNPEKMYSYDSEAKVEFEK